MGIPKEDAWDYSSDGCWEVLIYGKTEYAYGHIDSPIGGMTTDEWCAKYQIPRCMSIGELIEKSDVLIVLSPDNCEMHEQLCELPLRSGKLTYVDKTFAPDYATARRIFDNAEAHNTPCYSTSALRFAEEYAGIDPGKITAISTLHLPCRPTLP